MGPHPAPLIDIKGKPRLNPAFSAWMMALEPPRLSRTAALRCVGNAVNPLQAYAALGQLVGNLRVDDYQTGGEQG